MGAGQAGRRTAEHDGQRSDSHGKGQVAQVARWLATLKASGCLCLLDGRGNGLSSVHQHGIYLVFKPISHLILMGFCKMNKPTRILTAILVSLLLGGMFAYQDAQKNDPAYQQHPVTVVLTDFFCGSLAGLICYLGSGWLARRKERRLKQAEGDKFYDEVARELQEKKLVAGLWTKAYAEMGGDDAKARALYIKYRAAQLAEGSRQRRGEQQPEAQAEQRNPLEPAKQIANAPTKSKAGIILAVLAGVVIVIVILANSGNNSTSTTSSSSAGSANPVPSHTWPCERVCFRVPLFRGV